MCSCVRCRVAGVLFSVRSFRPRLHLETKYWAKQLALSWLSTCSLPSASVIVGKLELRCTPPARLTVDHHCLSVMLPLARRCRSWATWSACALWRRVAQARVAWRAFTRCWGDGDRDICFHASCLAETASLHSGVHHERSVGCVTSSIRDGMNCFIPGTILLETYSQD